MRLASRDKLKNQLLGKSSCRPMKENNPENSISKQDVSSGVTSTSNPQTNNLVAPELPAILDTNLHQEEVRLWDWCKSKLQVIKEMPQAEGFWNLLIGRS